MNVEGRVAPGRGVATGRVAEFARELCEIVGHELFPGSLNVVLNAPLRLDEAAGCRFDGGRRLLWPAMLDGAQVWLYRWRRAPLHVFEVVSTVRLRDALSLVDGQTVTIKIRDEGIGEVSFLDRLVWSAFWLGRRQWYYAHDRYGLMTERWCIRLGAAQAQRPGYRTNVRDLLRKLPVAPPLKHATFDKELGPFAETYVYRRGEAEIERARQDR